MKKIRITLKKGEAQATCLHSYREVSWPDKSEWSGERQHFQANGRLLDFTDGLDWLEAQVAHQAKLCGATATIEDLGGEAEFWSDKLEGF